MPPTCSARSPPLEQTALVSVHVHNVPNLLVKYKLHVPGQNAAMEPRKPGPTTAMEGTEHMQDVVASGPPDPRLAPAVERA